MRLKRVILWIGGTFIALVVMAVGFYCFGIDWQNRPCCHKLVMLSFMGQMHSSGGDILRDPEPFPNVNGSSLDSLATITESMGYATWTNDYNYVPGLREDDPPDLVLMYFNRPTRWNWHGAPPSIFNDKAWIVIPVDFEMGSGFSSRNGQLGECSERVSFDEFRTRLRRTLDFIRTNQRPNWQAVVAEHEKFLNSLEHQ